MTAETLTGQTTIPPAGAAGGLRSLDQWRNLFAGFSHIILVANSDAVDIEDLRKTYPPTTLFVFFNKVYKVLDHSFSGHAILVSRGGPKGANIVRLGEVEEVLAFFPKDKFLGILNLRVNADEKLNTAQQFAGAPTGHLDLTGFGSDFYPQAKVPTSGFVLALWLCDLQMPASIVLAGFSAKRSDKWRVVSVHDWAFEQVFLRLFSRVGKITVHGGVDANAYAALAGRFPEIPSHDIAMTIAEVLSERVGNANAEIDKLISLTNVIRSIDNFFRRLPKFRKKRAPPQ